MSTELTKSIDKTEVITTQDISIIILNMDAREIEFHIVDKNAAGEQIGDKKIYFEKFTDMGSTQKSNIRDVLKNTRQYARSINVLGTGTDTDTISGSVK